MKEDVSGGKENRSIIEYYNSYDEDGRLERDNAHKMEFLTTVRYLDKLLEPSSRILDVSAGTGKYAFYLAGKGHKVVAGDLVEKNAEIMREKQAENKIDIEIYVGNAISLSRFDDSSFDTILFMGPHYHLFDNSDRIKALKESLRVLKKGGLLFCSYVNRISMFLVEIYRRGRTVDDRFIQDLLKDGILTERKESVFYFSNPEEIQNLFLELPVEKIRNISADGVSYLIGDRLNNMSKDEFDSWMKYHYYTCEDPQLLGYSLHGLMICRKK